MLSSRKPLQKLNNGSARGDINLRRNINGEPSQLVRPKAEHVYYDAEMQPCVFVQCDLCTWIIKTIEYVNCNSLCYCNSERSSTRCQPPPEAVDVQYSTVKLPFWFIDTELLTSCCVTDKCDAPSGASVEQMRLVRLGEHHTTACWLETYDFTVTDKQQPVTHDQSPADTPQHARLR